AAAVALGADVDEVAAGGEPVLDLGPDHDPLAGGNFVGAVCCQHRGSELEEAEAVGISDHETEADAARLAFDLELGADPDRLVLLDRRGPLAAGVLEPAVEQARPVGAAGGARLAG